MITKRRSKNGIVNVTFDSDVRNPYGTDDSVVNV